MREYERKKEILREKPIISTCKSICNIKAATLLYILWLALREFEC